MLGWQAGLLRRFALRNDGLLAKPFQLLQAAAGANLFRHRRIWKTGLPVGDADLADIDVASGIQREPMVGQEFEGLEARPMFAANS